MNCYCNDELCTSVKYVSKVCAQWHDQALFTIQPSHMDTILNVMYISIAVRQHEGVPLIIADQQKVYEYFCFMINRNEDGMLLWML